MAGLDILLNIGEKGSDKVAAAGKKVEKSWLDTAAQLTIVFAGLTKIASGIASAMAGPIKDAEKLSKTTRKLDAAIGVAGGNVVETRKSFDGYADSMALLTGNTTDSIMEQQALFLSLTGNIDATNDAVFAANALSVANIEGGAATRALTQLANGEVGALGRVIPELRTLSKEQLKAGDGMKLIADKLGPVYLSTIDTVGAQYTRLTNIIGDRYLEAVASQIMENSKLKAALNVLGTELARVAPNVDTVGDALDSAAEYGAELLTTVIALGVAGVQSLMDLADIGLTVAGTFVEVQRALATSDEGIARYDARADSIAEMRHNMANYKDEVGDVGMLMVDIAQKIEAAVKSADKAAKATTKSMKGLKDETKAAGQEITITTNDILGGASAIGEKNDVWAAELKASLGEDGMAQLAEFGSTVDAHLDAQDQKTRDLISNIGGVAMAQAGAVGGLMASWALGQTSMEDVILGSLQNITGMVIDSVVNMVTAYSVSAAGAAAFSQAGIPVIGPILAVTAAGFMASFVKGLLGGLTKPQGMFFGGELRGGDPNRDSIPMMGRHGEVFRPPEIEKALQSDLDRLRGGASNGGSGQVTIQMMGMPSEGSMDRWMTDVFARPFKRAKARGLI